MIQIFDWASGEKTHDFRVGGNFFYERIKFHPSEQWILGAAGAGSESKLVFFDLEKKEIAYEKASGMLTFDMALDPNSDAVFVAGRRGAARHDTRGTIACWEWDVIRESRRF